MKRCGTCHQFKELDQFHRKANEADGRQPVCKACKKEYSRLRYLNDPASYRNYDKERRAELRVWAQSLKEGPCVDCGNQFHFRAMQWDHIGTDKASNVANLVVEGYGKKKILEEIAKCELVCAVCHAIRTWKREQQGPLE